MTTDFAPSSSTALAFLRALRLDTCRLDFSALSPARRDEALRLCALLYQQVLAAATPRARRDSTSPPQSSSPTLAAAASAVLRALDPERFRVDFTLLPPDDLEALVDILEALFREATRAALASRPTPPRPPSP